MSPVMLFWVIVLSLDTWSDAHEQCSRKESRIVQQYIETEIKLHYAAVGIKIPTECPLHLDTTAHYLHESMKFHEHASRFTCLMCGKSFYDEHFLDQHLVNRHSEVQRVGADIVCLADYCDVFRCEVISGKQKPKYWDKALCKDIELKERQEKCQMIVDKCVPSFIESSERHHLQDVFNKKLCNFLNCKDFWEVPESQLNPLSTAIYVMVFLILCVGLIIYYFIAYTHFYTDESLWDQWRQEEVRFEKRRMYQAAPDGQNIRYRTINNSR